jgi:periplasmic divalent cation tolerance protein
MQYDHVLVLTTCASEDQAAQIAEALVTTNAAACCNIIKDVRSLFIWQGKLEDDREVLLLTKTTTASFPKVRDTILKLHSYDVAEIIAVPIVDGSDDYLRWVKEQTSKK